MANVNLVAGGLQGDASALGRVIDEAPGPIYFAWVDPTETTFGSQHHRLDEDAFAFDIHHAEGDFAALTLQVRNPRVGLLSAGRKIWAWLAWKDGLGTVHPLFFGRLLGVPSDFFAEVVTLQFVARPVDFLAQKTALANTLKVLPYWDPAFIAEDKRADPDTALAARSAFWHIDRVTGLVTISDVLTGEDGVEEFFEVDEDVFDGSVQVSLGAPPVRSIYMEATANWTQRATGTIDFGEKHWLTFTGASFISTFPQPLQDVGGGWSVEASAVEDLNKVAEQVNCHFESQWTNIEKTHNNGDQLSQSFSMDMPSYVTDVNKLGPYLGGLLPNYLSHVVHQEIKTGILDPGDTLSEVFGENEPKNEGSSENTSYLLVPLSRLRTTLTLRYTAARARTELGIFAMQADVQPLITLADEDVPPRVTFSSVPLDQSLGIWGAAPLSDPSLSGYWATPRGIQSAYYITLTGRAMLRFSSRAVNITFGTTIERAIAMSCRKSARLHWRKLPGGQATGKVIEYTFHGDGDTGNFEGSVKIGCAIGHGGAATGAAGVGVYAAAGYTQLGYQQMTGQITVLPTADIGLTTPYISGTDDGLVFPLSYGQVVTMDQVTGSAIAQANAIEAAFLEDEELDALTSNPVTNVETEKKKAQLKTKTVAEVIKTVPVKWELHLKPVTGGPFNYTNTMFLTPLKIEQGINLEATS